MKDVLCTVLLISYNSRKYIKKAIESIIEQKTEYGYIIKIYDDGSNDGTQDIINEYVKKYPNKIIPYLYKKNCGAQINILKAYKSVDTKYCAILEADDYWCNPCKLQTQIKALEHYPECSFSSHNTISININCKERNDSNNKLIVTNRKMQKCQFISLGDLRTFENDYITHVSSRVIRTSCIDIDSLKSVEDFLYDNCQYYYLLLKGKMHYTNEIMSVYCINNESSYSSLEVNKKIRCHCYRLLEFNKNYDYKIEDIIYRSLRQFINYWLGKDDKKYFNNSFIKKVKKTVNYFIPRFILDVFEIPRNIIRLIKKYLIKNNNQRII